VTGAGGVMAPGTAEAYEAAVRGLALFERSSRTRLRVHGRAPRQMLNGIVTGTLPAAPEIEPGRTQGGAAVSGTGTYHAVLTPKGKMISDAWVFLPGDEEADGFLLDVPAEGAAALAEHLRKVLPPRLAALDDVSDRTGMIAVVGPDAAAALSRVAFGLRVEAEALTGLQEGEWIAVGPLPGALLVARTREVAPDAFWVFGPAVSVAALRTRLLDGGAVAGDEGTWTTLRVEAGRPAWGFDMSDATIPVEAGIHTRAIDHKKGCYTGQEVIVRIRDRGHVNRHLRRLVLGQGPLPEPGTELRSPDGDGKPVGWITSAVRSPVEQGGVVALAYVRRGVTRLLWDGREIVVEDAS